MHCLLIDNYDSFTYNLADYIGQTFGEMPTVLHNDQYTWAEICQRFKFDCIVISPGPGSVVKPIDFHVSRQAVSQNEIPVFGVCLGFQGIAHQHGAQILHCPEPFHGRTSSIFHNNDPMFANIPTAFEVVRYHSLMVQLPDNSSLIETASSHDGVVQALRHKTLPKWGVQFHPESILTEHGQQILRNFRDLSFKHINKAQIQLPRQLLAVEKPLKQTDREITQKFVVSRKLSISSSPETLFSSLFADKAHCFWLDSQSPSQHCRFSFMGCGEDARDFRYNICNDSDDFTQGEAILTKMDRLLSNIKVAGGEDLPFSFVGGLVGYLSYEMKALFGAKKQFTNTSPDMLWMTVDRFLAFDHHCNEVYLVACHNQGGSAVAVQWLDDITQQLSNLSPRQATKPHKRSSLKLEMDKGYQDYIKAIRQCLSAIIEGDSYEVCLTNHFAVEADIAPYELYLAMRTGNAAPFGAFIHSDEVSVLSTSPERFLEVSANGCVQAKPIKGTCKRSNDPKQDKALAESLKNSEKDRAENLMIVDLMRNDLNRVSKPNSVNVPRLMEIESFQTVHQLVSTVESQLADDQTLIDLIRATFPGGSISGAPKLRTMEIIDELENGPRGAYCGAIGYLGYNRVADLNIGIRTLTYDSKNIRFGAGGAITYLSNPHEEFEEIMLKAEAVIKPVWQFFGGDSDKMVHQVEGNGLLIFDANE